MLEIDIYVKNCFKNDIELNSATLIACVAKADSTSHARSANKCWLCEKENKIKDKKENPVDEGHCQISGSFIELAHKKFNLNTQKGQSAFVPILVQNFSAYDSHLIFRKSINMSTGKGIKINEEDIIAKSSESYISVKTGCLKFLDSFRFWMLAQITYLQHYNLFHL